MGALGGGGRCPIWAAVFAIIWSQDFDVWITVVWHLLMSESPDPFGWIINLSLEILGCGTVSHFHAEKKCYLQAYQESAG